jgi:hypothetical protein
VSPASVVEIPTAVFPLFVGRSCGSVRFCIYVFHRSCSGSSIPRQEQPARGKDPIFCAQILLVFFTADVRSPCPIRLVRFSSPFSLTVVHPSSPVLASHFFLILRSGSSLIATCFNISCGSLDGLCGLAQPATVPLLWSVLSFLDICLFSLQFCL